ncbi:phosphonoacetaldehyde hydrolase [Clostridium cavendishii DSM 21758]|uniref:Phosphonoacetaldehyde hydrolase n=1 Tax=Clostridium cavendishii DSM 21758 TaxID=1121302 RepID=A0A1M6SKI1_9CLOT|nr:phosphonoacetaldehyde hydrolase [Clostridium cavendishii]SHK45160.1 phosphonoacetaldehyde hydrolase [Clostridium cavendishii DSM 21758]
MDNIEAVVFDWAGTTVDFGCFAPVNAFCEVFKQEGINITLEEAREPMGKLKRDHIMDILEMPRIRKFWENIYGRIPNNEDVERLYSKFEQLLMSSLSDYTEPLPYVVETVEFLRDHGIKIGSTTGYTDNMMKLVLEGAKKKGYEPDFIVTPDATNFYGRPFPYMIFRNIEKLKISSVWKVIKVGDTEADIKEGINAGVWSIGVVVGSSKLGLNKEEFESLSESEKRKVMKIVRDKFLGLGADFVIDTMNELPELIGKINMLIREGKRPGTWRKSIYIC